MIIRLIGDVHQLHNRYLKLISKADFSIQLGDFGFEYDCLRNVDANKHKILAGNHENYGIVNNYPHFLGDFGYTSLGGLKFFFVRGGFSIDKWSRTPGIDWFANEELNHMQAKEAIALYEQIKPDFVISHECPQEITPFAIRGNKLFDPSYTARLLQTLYGIHRPKMWVFAHYHKSWNFSYEGLAHTSSGMTIDNGYRKPTQFIALDILERYDISL